MKCLYVLAYAYVCVCCVYARICASYLHLFPLSLIASLYMYIYKAMSKLHIMHYRPLHYYEIIFTARIYNFWKPEPWSNTRLFQYNEASGKVTVKTAGLYLIYGQVK